VSTEEKLVKSEQRKLTYFALQLPTLKQEATKGRFAVKRTTPPYRGRWVFAAEIHAGDYGGGWPSFAEAKKECSSFLTSKVAKDHKIVSVSIVKLDMDITLDVVEQVVRKSASIVDRIAQTDL